METVQLQAVRTQLAAVLGELKERKANPFKGTALEALAAEIRTLRKTYRLSYREIAAKLTALKVDTSEEQIAEFCRFFLKSGSKRGARRRRPSAGE